MCHVLNNKKPSKSTIGCFFKGRELCIELLFDYIVNLGLDLDLIGLENVSIDGTILKAYASKYRLTRIEELDYLENLIKSFFEWESFHDFENKENILFKTRKYYLDDILDESNENIINEIENNLKKEGIDLLKKSMKNSKETESILKFIKYLKDNYDGKHTISVTDPESRWMKDKSGIKGLNYNYQVAIDDKNDFIVAQELVNEPTDHYQLIPMIQNTKRNLSKHPNFYTADNGYLTNKAVEYLYQHNIKAIMPDRDESSKMKNKITNNKFKKPNFQYKWDNDTYVCPENKILRYQNNRKIKYALYRVYSTNECKNAIILKSAHLEEREKFLS